MHKIFYVTGMHSSGTSLTANYLQHCGVSMMGTAPIDFLGEDKKFRIISHKILKDSKIHRYDKHVFDSKKLNPSENTKELMLNQIVNNLSTVRDKNWGWKAPINSLCIWHWLPLLQNNINGSHKLYVIVIFRHPAEVIKSFYRRKSRKDVKFMATQGGNPYENLEHVWSNYYQSVLDFCEQSNDIDAVFIHTRDMMETPEILTKALGLPDMQIDGVIDKNRFKPEQKLIFHTNRSKRIWNELMEIRKCK
jgi:hypothetical protein